MIYCINPDCKQRQNPDELEYCQNCGTPLLIEDRYRLIQPLRQLDMRSYTDIFEVGDRGTRKVMKVLKDNSPQLVEMFEREAYTLQYLEHPGIPKVEIDGDFIFTPNNSTQELRCLVMEKIEGDNLEQWIKKHGKISQCQALEWLRQLIKILDVLHQHHLFHRDIKPSNIVRRPDGQLALIDFGSVRGIEETYLAKLALGKLTTIISGGYTPQEQIEGKAIPQSDFYALGRTLVYLLTGKSPVDFPTDPKTGKLSWRKEAQVSEPLADFIDELMAPFSADRPQNTTAILPYLNIKGLLIKSLLRLLTSPKLKLLAAIFLAGAITGLGVYRWSFPAQAEYYINRGLEDLKNGRLDSAKKNYEKAINFEPKDAIARNLLGLACQELKDFDCAEKAYKQALKLKPDYATANYNLGGLYDDWGDYKRAADRYEITMNSPKSNYAVDARNNLARVKILQRDDREAVKLILQSLRQTKDEPSQLALYKNLGWARFQQGRYEEAKTYLRKAIALDKKKEMVAAHCLLAQVLQVQGNKVGATIAWKDCLRDGSYDSSLPEVKAWQSIAQPNLQTTVEKQ